MIICWKLWSFTYNDVFTQIKFYYIFIEYKNELLNNVWMNWDSHNRLAARQSGHVGDTAHTPGHANNNYNDIIIDFI